jgi:ribosome maturation factor RimP
VDLKALKITIENLVKSLDYHLYEIQYVNERRNNILRVTIDKNTGIDIDDCVKVSGAISAMLDETNPISDDYSLEVTSPGAERLLRDRVEIRQAVGRYVHVDTYEQKFEGDLIGFENDSLTLKVRNKLVEIKYIDITLIRLAIKF